MASLLRDRAAAEDVTAQAFERAYRQRRSFRPARGTPEAWVFGIARNAALDELRRRKRRAALDDELEDHGAAAVEDAAELAIRREAVRAALAGLDRASATWWRSSSWAGSPTPRSPRVLGVSRVQRRHTTAPDPDQAEGGLP